MDALCISERLNKGHEESDNHSEIINKMSPMASCSQNYIGFGECDKRWDNQQIAPWFGKAINGL